MRYRVIAPYVMLRIPDPVSGKATLVGFHVGAVLPAGTDQDDIDRHLRKGMIETLDLPEPEPAKPAKAAPGKAVG